MKTMRAQVFWVSFSNLICLTGRRTLVLLNQRDSLQEVQINDLATGHRIHLRVDPRSIATVLWDKQ